MQRPILELPEKYAMRCKLLLFVVSKENSLSCFRVHFFALFALSYSGASGRSHEAIAVPDDRDLGIFLCPCLIFMFVLMCAYNMCSI